MRGRHAGRQFRLILFGVLWGMVITGIEIPSMPVTITAARPFSMLLFLQVLQWSMGGLVLSGVLWLSTRDEVRWWRLALLLPVAAAINGLMMVELSRGFRRVFGHSLVDPLLDQPLPAEGVILYTAWLTLIYGSAAALIYALRRRIDQTTAALQGLALARERNEAAVAEARVSAMVEQIEPRFLLEVMHTARRQYLVRAEEAEATLNACTEFLRAAMLPLRSGRSTVAAELALVAAYLALRDRMAGREPDWRIDRRPASASSGSPELDDVPLPPMTLMPIVEQLIARRPDRAAIAMDVSAEDAAIEIRIEASPPSPQPGIDDDFDAAWLAAVSTRLTRVCGRAASLRSGNETGDARRTLIIVVPRRDDPP